MTIWKGMERNMANTWKELREELNLTAEDEAAINFEKELVKTMIEIREKNAFESDKIANDFIKKNERNIYSGGFMEPFDVRGYAKFMKEHQLSAKDITPEIMQKFVK